MKDEDWEFLGSQASASVCRSVAEWLVTLVAGSESSSVFREALATVLRRHCGGRVADEIDRGERSTRRIRHLLDELFGASERLRLPDALRRLEKEVKLSKPTKSIASMVSRESSSEGGIADRFSHLITCKKVRAKKNRECWVEDYAAFKALCIEGWEA